VRRERIAERRVGARAAVGLQEAGQGWRERWHGAG
jgi:hypothetical protein